MAPQPQMRRPSSSTGDWAQRWTKCARFWTEELLDVRYESFTQRPEQHLRQLCDFLGVTPSFGDLRACSSIVDPSPSRSRDRLPWSDDERREVQAIIEGRPVLAGYDFDS